MGNFVNIKKRRTDELEKDGVGLDSKYSKAAFLISEISLGSFNDETKNMPCYQESEKHRSMQNITQVQGIGYVNKTI